MLVAQFTVLLFAAGMLYISILMMNDPVKFLSNTARFSNWQYFHPFEITSRFIFALGFYFAQHTTTFQPLYLFMTGILLFTTFFLIVIGKKRHQAFARMISKQDPRLFRWSGFMAFFIALFFIYTLFL